MYTRSGLLALPLTFLSLGARTALAACETYGIDFSNGGEYFINQGSNDNFTLVSQFSGCSSDTANIILEDPSGNEYQCSDVPLQPDYTSELSTCPIKKSQMTSGTWTAVIISNNGNADPLANQRSFQLDIGVQTTVTVTPTLVYNYTMTPTITTTSTIKVTTTTNVNNIAVITKPSTTITETVKPTAASTTTRTTTLTQTHVNWAKTAYINTVTATPSCIVPSRPRSADPVASAIPSLISLPIKIVDGVAKEAGSVVNNVLSGVSSLFKNIFQREETVGGHSTERSERLRLRSLSRAQAEKRDLKKRSADAQTVTSTQTTSTATSTATFTAPTTSTFTDVAVSTTTVTNTLPPVTTTAGALKLTVSLSTPVYTAIAVVRTTTEVTKTMTAVYTRTVWATPNVSACRKQGGHF